MDKLPIKCKNPISHDNVLHFRIYDNTQINKENILNPKKSIRPFRERYLMIRKEENDFE
jgi:hypothetical protein